MSLTQTHAQRKARHRERERERERPHRHRDEIDGGGVRVGGRGAECALIVQAHRVQRQGQDGAHGLDEGELENAALDGDQEGSGERGREQERERGRSERK